MGAAEESAAEPGHESAQAPDRSVGPGEDAAAALPRRPQPTEGVSYARKIDKRLMDIVRSKRVHA